MHPFGNINLLVTLGARGNSTKEEVALTQRHGCPPYDGSCKRRSLCYIAGEKKQKNVAVAYFPL